MEALNIIAQGSQFTSDAFTGVLKREGVAISMDGCGRALDNIFVERLWRNVKYEDVYLKEYANQALGYATPDHVYRAGVGGGAMIVDKFGDADHNPEKKAKRGSAEQLLRWKRA